MISSLRPAVARVVTKSIQTRRLTSRPSASDGAILNDAFAALDSIAPGAGSAITPSRPIIPKPTDSPAVMTIPPREDPLLHYLTSALLTHGHRARASRIVSRTLLYVHSFTRAPPLPIIREAIFAASPAVRCMSHRHGGKTVMTPIALGEKQRTRFGVRCILKASENKPGKTVEERLARELIAVVQGSSEALKKKEEIHRSAMVNRGNVKRGSRS